MATRNVTNRTALKDIAAEDTQKNTKQDVVNDAKATTASAEKDKKESYKIKSADLDPNMYVPVRNGFNGKLIYVSRKSGERYVWENFGDEQDLELRELRAAKTSYKAFFENNWFLIDDPAVIEYLGVERYYANALSYDDFDDLFTLDPGKIESRISKLSKGQIASLAYRAKQLIREGAIDSIKVINTLEKALGIELIEKQGDD